VGSNHLVFWKTGITPGAPCWPQSAAAAKAVVCNFERLKLEVWEIRLKAKFL